MRSAPRPGLQYDIELPDGTKVFDQWKWEESRFLEAKKKNQIVFRKDSRGKWRIEYKSYLNNSERVPRSLLTKVERNSQGRAQLRDIFREDDVFNNPKPVGLIKHLLQFSTDSDSLIVDLFAGSSTTAEAVLELNEEDGGNRRFIMVQLPEPTPEGSKARKAGYETIADIGKERIRLVLAKIKEGNLFRKSEDLGVRIFKLTESHYRLWDGIEDDASDAYAEQMQLFADSPLIEGWITENVIYEVAIKEGYRLDSSIELVAGIENNAIFRVVSADEQQSFFICLDEELFQDELNKLGLKNDDLFVCRDQALDDTKAANLALQCRLKTI
jgi:adenine-specific DNA-methyltransferase